MRLELTPRGILTLAGIAGGIWLLILIWPVVLIAIFSLVFAVSLLPALQWLQRHGVHRIVAVFALLTVLLLAVVLVDLLVAPALYAQGQRLVAALPQVRERLVQLLASHGAGNLAGEVQRANPASLLQPRTAADTAISLLGGLITAGTIVVLTAYILLDAERIEQLVYLITPATYHVHVRYLLATFREVVGGYMSGQLATSLAITVYTFVVLLVLRIPDPLPLAVFAGIADVIPVVGTVLAVVPPVLVALTVSVPKAIVVVVALLLYREFENVILVPRIYGNSLRMPGIVIMLALLIGTQIGGMVGAFFALPAAAALRALIIYIHDIRTQPLTNVTALPATATASENDAMATDAPAKR
jgi:predicted PurR-regulated permease PerM